MNNQSIFNKVAEHLLRQGCHSKIGGAFRYRTSTGLACAIGCLIDDKYYIEALEGQMFHESYYVRNAVADSLGMSRYDMNLDFMDSLQNVHDDFEPKDWPHQLAEVATSFGLKMATPVDVG